MDGNGMAPDGCIICGDPENPVVYECRNGHKMCEECKLHNDQGYADAVELDGMSAENYERFEALAQGDQHDNEHKLNARQRLMRRYDGDVERLKIKSGTDPSLPDWQRAANFKSKEDYDQLKREVEVEKRTLILQGLEEMGIDPDRATEDDRAIALIMEINSGPCPACKGKVFKIKEAEAAGIAVMQNQEPDPSALVDDIINHYKRRSGGEELTGTAHDVATTLRDALIPDQTQEQFEALVRDIARYYIPGRDRRLQERNPQQAMRLDIAEHGRGAAAAVHVPRQRRQSEDDAAAAIAASMESLRDDEMRREQRLRAQGNGAAAVVHVPRRQSEDDAAAAIAASMESLRDDEMRREQRLRAQGNGAAAVNRPPPPQPDNAAIIAESIELERIRLERKQAEDAAEIQRAVALIDQQEQQAAVGDEDELLAQQARQARQAQQARPQQAPLRQLVADAVPRQLVADAVPRQLVAQGNTGTGAVKWMTDKEATACCRCESKFSFFKRKHHCRGCGKIFCNDCCTGTGDARKCTNCNSMYRGGYKMSRKSKLSKMSRKSKLSKMSRKSKLSKMSRKSKLQKMSRKSKLPKMSRKSKMSRKK